MKTIVLKAKRAEAMGYTHMASVVKTVYNTVYYNVVPVKMVKERGAWVPAPVASMPAWHGRIGTPGSKVDWDKTILRNDWRLN